MARRGRTTSPWYLREGSETGAQWASRILSHVDGLRQQQYRYRDSARYWMQLRNGSRDLSGDGLYVGQDGRMRYNLLASAVDTMTSIVASNRPVPQPIVKSGDWSLQQRAKKKGRVMQTLAQELKLFEKSTLAYDHACTVQIGWLHWMRHPDTGGPHVEVCQPLEVIWDAAEGRNGPPRSLFRMRLVNREQLAALYSAKASDIRRARSADHQLLVDFDLSHQLLEVDSVLVVEGWHLPSSSRSSDGRHVMAVDGALLVNEPLTRARYPLSPFRWMRRQVGYMGRSLVSEGEGAQERIHRLIEYVEECQDLGSGPKVFLQNGSNLTEEDVDNLAMSVYRYDGESPPIFFTFDATPTDLVAEIDRIREQFWSEKGLNQLQVQGQKPAGINSGVGLRRVDDIADRRHSQNIRQYEHDMLGAYQCLSDLLDDIAAADATFEVRESYRSRFLETTRLADLNVDEGDGRWTVFPISSLPTTPGARAERVEELAQAGWITREVALQLHGLSDLEAYEDLETSDLRLAQRQVAQILDGKAFAEVGLSDYQDIAVAADYARKRFVSAVEEGADDEVLDELEMYLLAARARITADQAAMAAPAMPADGAAEMPADAAPEMPAAAPVAAA